MSELKFSAEAQDLAYSVQQDGSRDSLNAALAAALAHDAERLAREIIEQRVPSGQRMIDLALDLDEIGEGRNIGKMPVKERMARYAEELRTVLLRALTEQQP